MKFSSLGLAPELQRAIDDCGYVDMTPVQEQSIVEARRGRDILASAQTGTGKTAAFALPLLQKMCDKPLEMNAGEVRALILTPTRELAEQLGNTISRYAQFLPLQVNALYGGGRTSSQESKLKAGSDILIATPGRLLEHVLQCNVNLSKVEFLVLDEADRMLDMGFIADVQGLLQQAPEQRQTLLFSATVSGAVEQLAHKLLKRHITIKVAKLNATADTVEHLVFPVEERRKAELFIELLREQNWFHVLVFTSTKDQADRLLKALKTEKLDVAVCHGDKTQGSRRRAIADFKSGKLQILIATEVAARGLDIQGLEQVVNFNLPIKTYQKALHVGAATKLAALNLAMRIPEAITKRGHLNLHQKSKRSKVRPKKVVVKRSNIRLSILEDNIFCRYKDSIVKRVSTLKNRDYNGK